MACAAVWEQGVAQANHCGNLSREATRRLRVLFLADRNILANQAFNAFSAFPEDALVRIEPGDIRKKCKDNVDTYDYFGEPVYIYSLNDGINDGFLTPFKVKQISTTIACYTYTSDGTVVEDLEEKGFGHDPLAEMQTIIGAEASPPFTVSALRCV